MTAAVSALPEPPGRRIAGRLQGFVRLLRGRGFAIGLAESGDALALLDGDGIADPRLLKQSLKALLSGRPADWRAFDALFDAYWLGSGVRSRLRASGGRRRADRDRGAGSQAAGPSFGLPNAARHGETAEAASGEGRGGGASSREALAGTDLRFVQDPDELAQLEALAERLARRLRRRLGRRAQVKRQGRRADLRRTIHRSIPHGGTPLRLAFRRRRPKPRRLVVLLDVSGSMSLYSSFFVRFLHGLTASFRDAEAYLFHTRLVHLTPILRDGLRPRPGDLLARAVDRMALVAGGWSGGTRIADSLKTFNDHHAGSVMRSDSLVIVVSDGYDTCDPETLGLEMARLKRRARRLVWLNPMAGWRDYAPVAGGMTAALPHIDLFAPAHSLKSLLALEPALTRL